MTKFDDIMSMINRNKNKNKRTLVPKDTNVKNITEENDNILEVSGSETNRAPLISSADDNSDPDIISELYNGSRPRNIPLRGEFASSWDSDY